MFSRSKKLRGLLLTLSCCLPVTISYATQVNLSEFYDVEITVVLAVSCLEICHFKCKKSRMIQKSQSLKVKMIQLGIIEPDNG